jgi:hypothetical protein
MIDEFGQKSQSVASWQFDIIKNLFQLLKKFAV